jgi:hypothetical protein
MNINLSYIQRMKEIFLPGEGVCLLDVEGNFLLNNLPFRVFAFESGFAQLLHDITLLALRVFQEFACLVQLLSQRVFLLQRVHPLLKVHLKSFIALCKLKSNI